MIKSDRPLRIAVIAGEESGDQLGADLVRSLKARCGGKIELVGVGGVHLQAEGLQTLFDPGIIAIVGVTSVVRDLPRLLRLIGSTAKQIAQAKPDCVITIDSPAFNLRVARKIRQLDSSIPIVKYVCPTVWGWLPSRARKMKEFTDHVLCLLPFEPGELERLGGPPGTFVGHRLSDSQGIAAARKSQMARKKLKDGSRQLLILPGSRVSEVASLGEAFVEAANLLKKRGHVFHVSVPTVARVEAQVKNEMKGLETHFEVTTDEQSKWDAFGRADAALAASGTVSLELALAGVPFISCYKTDVLMKLAYPFITAWSASLPNLIADRPVVPEYYDRFVRPANLARTIEMLWTDGAPRNAQLQGFDDVRAALATDKPAGDRAAEIVLGLI